LLSAVVVLLQPSLEDEQGPQSVAVHAAGAVVIVEHRIDDCRVDQAAASAARIAQGAVPRRFIAQARRLESISPLRKSPAGSSLRSVNSVLSSSALDFVLHLRVAGGSAGASCLGRSRGPIR